MRNFLALLLAALLGIPSLASAVPEVGSTYQLDRSQYANVVTACTSEKLMGQFVEHLLRGKLDAQRKMIREVSDFDQIERLKKNGGCVEITSGSQATILKNGVEFHLAEFAAFPFVPLWGQYLYFGRKVR